MDIDKTAKRPKKVRLPDVIGSDERERLLSAPPAASMMGVRARAILGLMARNGLRVSEVCGLVLTDLRLSVDDPYVRVIGKGDKERRAFVGPGTISVLQEWLKMRPKVPGRALFPVLRSGRRGKGVSKVGRPISRQTIYAMVRRYAAKAGIERSIHPHTLRHTAATLALRSGENLRRVQEMLGHAHVSQTQVYTHLAGGELADMAKRLDPGVS